jgi:hypothetical protein
MRLERVVHSGFLPLRTARRDVQPHPNYPGRGFRAHPSQITGYESRIKNSNLFGAAISHELLTLVAARIGASCSAVDLTGTNKIGHGRP